VIVARRADDGVHVTVKRLKPGVTDEIPPPKTYPGSKRAIELFDKLMPLKAVRSLGKPTDTELKPMGLDEPKSTLTLKHNGTTNAVAIGSATYGSGDRYARLDSGEVYLLSGVTISGLRGGAHSLLEKRALNIEAANIRRAKISAGARSRELSHRVSDEDPKKSFFSDPAAPDEKLEQVSNWMDRILKLRIVDVSEAKPKGPASLTVEFFDTNKSVGKLMLWQPGDKTAAATATPFDSPVTVAKANAEVILRDIDAVLEEGR